MKYVLSCVTVMLSLLGGIMTTTAQTNSKIRGTVYELDKNQNRMPLVGASVSWEGTSVGGNTNENGAFAINRVKGYTHLKVEYLGYKTQVIEVKSSDMHRSIEIELKSEGIDVEEVVVNGSQRGNRQSVEAIGKKELITFSGLCKMACCNLAESFENSASVTVGYSDAISGARQIKMLGMTGIYTQMLDENRPIMRGLASPYGLSYTPGMWLQSIQVSKGVASVVNGHEAMSGQINLEHRKPTDQTPLFVNLYTNQDLRGEVNVSTSQQLSPRLSTVLLAHGSMDTRKYDHNHDGFLDMPLARQANVANRWLYQTPAGVQVRAGAKFVYEERQSGQMDFDPNIHRGGTTYYGSEIFNKNFNSYLKIGVPVGQSVYNEEKDVEEQSNVAMIFDYNYYQQQSYFGLKEYDGHEHSFLGNLFYQHHFNKRHKMILGGSATWDRSYERLDDRYKSTIGDFEYKRTLIDRDEKIAGGFAEYTYNFRDKFNLILGGRADYANFYGWFYTPRGHMRWVIAEGLTFRASGGLGYRSANLITDNIGMMATGRRLMIDNHLDRMEKTLTYGASLTKVFHLWGDDEASVSIDAFRSEFRNQIVVDQEYDSRTVRYYNLDGDSYTNTYQFDFNWSPFQGFDLFATFRYNDTRITLNRASGEKTNVEKPLIDKFKTLLNLQYATKFSRWVFDFTAQLNGSSRMPVEDGDISVISHSPVYPIFYGQVTRKFRHLDIYVGCENIGDYRQHKTISSANNPFDTKFNSSRIWGPLMGRNVYLGLRFNLL